MVLHYILIIVTVVTSILATQTKDLNRAIAAFATFNVSLSIIFYILGAPYVAVFQLLIYAGAVTVLFLAALHTMRRE